MTPEQRILTRIKNICPACSIGSLDNGKCANCLDNALSSLMDAIHLLSHLTDEKLTHFESSPTKNPETARRWMALSITTDIANERVAAQSGERTAILVGALKEIAEHKFVNYDAATGGIYEGQYGVGVVDGHRACAMIARAALGKWKESSPPSEPGSPVLRCMSCGTPYSEFPLDVVIPDDQWKAITGRPDGGGVMCAACIVEAGAKLNGVTVAKLKFE